MYKFYFPHIWLFIAYLFIRQVIAQQPGQLPTHILQENLKLPVKQKTIPPCHVCHSLVKSFLQAFEDTSRQGFEGGDAVWEKQKLGSYENSELRMIEIQEKLCVDMTTGKDQCYNMAELHESKLEEWFYEKRKDVDLMEFLCINYLKICCPDNTYGPDCRPCPGGTETPCSGHGRCEKGGTREEPASCSCYSGYTGILCDVCEKGFYQNVDSPTLSCISCDKACKDHCRGPGPQNCEVCTDGYHFVPNQGCVDDFEKNSNEMLNETEDDKTSLTESELTDTGFENAKPTEHSEL